MAWLLDTSAAILLRDADSVTDDRVAILDDVPAISVVTHVELEGGVRAKPHLEARRRAALDILLTTLSILPFDPDCVGAYRRIVEAIGFSRRDVIDRMIAATALAHGLRLITTNGRDFMNVPGLKLEVWPVA